MLQFVFFYFLIVHFLWALRFAHPDEKGTNGYLPFPTTCCEGGRDGMGLSPKPISTREGKRQAHNGHGPGTIPAAMRMLSTEGSNAPRHRELITCHRQPKLFAHADAGGLSTVIESHAAADSELISQKKTNSKFACKSRCTHRCKLPVSVCVCVCCGALKIEDGRKTFISMWQKENKKFCHRIYHKKKKMIKFKENNFIIKIIDKDFFF